MLKMARKYIETSESLKFYKYLCRQIGSEKVVRIRRLAFVISDIGQISRTITSGSIGEGLDLKGSDLDVMWMDRCFKVYESETEAKDQVSAIPLIMSTEETQPCFTQLCYLSQENIIYTNVPRTIPNMFKKTHLGYMLSSELYKLDVLSNQTISLISKKVHGPCISFLNDTFDLARCIKCDKWISQAMPWVRRARTSWPSSELISKIISCGVLFVPIGCKGSTNENLEWRISFSVAEKNLVFSFSHTQLLCYAMLKIMLKEIIDEHEDLKGLLCSYFLKSLMFWISEETETYVWRPDNIISCFMACLQRLIYCVRYSVLSHYFIPDKNLFFLRFNTNIREKFTIILKNLYRQGIYCFAHSETLKDYQSQSGTITESFISKNVIFSKELMITFDIIRSHGRGHRFSRLLYHFLHHSRTDLSRGLFALQLSAAFMIAPEATQERYNQGNKHHYLSYKRDLSHLIIGLQSDAISGLLKLASFFYVHESYFASLTIISYILQKYTAEKIFTGSFYLVNTFNHIQKHVLNLIKKEKLHTIIKSLLIHTVTFLKDSSIIPQELQLDVTRIHNTFHPLSFAYFLSSLCCFHLHDIASCRQSLHRLNHVQWTHLEGCTTFFIPESLNILILRGIIHKLMGETKTARLIFQQAADRDKNNLTSARSRLSSLI